MNRCFRVCTLPVAALFCGLLLTGAALAQSDGKVAAFQKISSTEGNFTGILNNDDRFRVVAGLGDLDGDGVEDLAVGATRDDDGGGDRGAVWILFLNLDGTVRSHQKISSTEGNFTGALSNSDFFGVSVVRLGDLDNDGIEDLAVGAEGDDDGGADRGAVWILFMNSNGTVKAHQKISQTQGGFTGLLGNSVNFGNAVAGLGDLDGDGIEDLAVGTYHASDGGTQNGAVWILLLNSDGTVKANQKISETQGNFTGVLDNVDQFGVSVAALGDLDGDTIMDLAVGANGDDDGGTDRGAVWVLFLNTNGTVKSHQKISDTQGNFTGIFNNSDLFGRSIAGLGDFDGDGIEDLAAGAIFDDDGGTDRGAVWVLFLNSNGTVKSYQKISATEGDFTGALDNSDYFSYNVANLGDLNGDGITDLAVGAQLDDDGGADRGAAWILFMHSINPNIFVNAGLDRTINFSQSVKIGGTPTANGGATPYSYSWSPVDGLNDPNSANPTAGPVYTTIYTVTVTDFNNVTGEDEVTVTVNGSPAARITSFFDTDDEGWTIFGDAQGGSGIPDYLASGGNPGGYISALDDETGIYWYWQAPAKFLGNIACAYGGSLTFDLKQSDASNPANNDDVILEGGGLTLVFDTPNNPGTAWTSYFVSLTETAGWKVQATGLSPTPAEMLAVLSSLQTLRIRGEYRFGPDRGDLDNVALNLVTSLATATVSGDATICAGGSTTISAELTGTAPWDITWSDGFVQNGVASSPATRMVSPASTTTYTVISIYDASCTGISSGSATVTVNSGSVTANAGADLATAAGVSAKLGANPTGSGTGSLTYLWSPADGLSSATVANPTATPSSTTTYEVTVEDANGCTATDQVTVRAGNLVNSRIKAIIGLTNLYDPVLNQVRADIAIKNISSQPIYGPLTAVFKTLTPGPPTITIGNADGGGNGLGCYYDYSNSLGGDNILSPGETSGYKLWIFQEHVTPPKSFKFFADVVGDLDGVPKVAADDQPLALAFDLHSGVVQDYFASSLADNAAEIPETYALYQNHPNPFNPSTTIQFDLPEAGEATLKIYNNVGQLVRTLVSGEYEAGSYKVTWDARNDGGGQVTTGVYLAVFKAGKVKQVRRVMLMK